MQIVAADKRLQTVLADKRWAEKYPEIGTGPVSAEPLISQEHFELEREKVFRRTWLNIGRVEEVLPAGLTLPAREGTKAVEAARDRAREAKLAFAVGRDRPKKRRAGLMRCT